MWTFTLAISCLITSYLPWFMDLTFQVPMQYCFFYSIGLYFHHQTHLQLVLFLLWLSLFIPLEPFLHSSPVSYWAPIDLGNLSCIVMSFCLFILFMGFSRQECWNTLPFPSQWTTFCLFMMFMGFSRQEYWFASPFSSGLHSVRLFQNDWSILDGPTWHVLVSLS